MAEPAERLYRTMAAIRGFETSSERLLKRGELTGNIHLSIGQEAVAAGEIRVGVEPALAARLLSGLVNSVVEWYRPGRPGTANLPDDVARAVFEGILPVAG